jgi:hypothetical protein
MSEIKTPFCNRSMRPSLDDFPLTQHLALAAMGEMSSEPTHPSVTIAGMTREVRVAHRKFPDGGLVIPSLPDVRKTANAQIVRTAFMLALRRPDVSLQAARQWTEGRAARKAPLPHCAPRARIERSQVQSPARQPARETHVIARCGARQIPRGSDRGRAAMLPHPIARKSMNLSKSYRERGALGN